MHPQLDEYPSIYLIQKYLPWKDRRQKSGDPGKIRTSDLRFRKPSLYPPELRGHIQIRIDYAAAG